MSPIASLIEAFEGLAKVIAEAEAARGGHADPSLLRRVDHGSTVIADRQQLEKAIDDALKSSGLPPGVTGLGVREEFAYVAVVPDPLRTTYFKDDLYFTRSALSNFVSELEKINKERGLLIYVISPLEVEYGNPRAIASHPPITDDTKSPLYVAKGTRLGALEVQVGLNVSREGKRDGIAFLTLAPNGLVYISLVDQLATNIKDPNLRKALTLAGSVLYGKG